MSTKAQCLILNEKMLLKHVKVIQKKTLYNSAILKVLSLHSLSCIGTGKYLKTSRKTRERVYPV